MYKKQEQLNEIVAATIRRVASFAAHRWRGQCRAQTGNNGRMFINLKPWGQA